MYIAKQYADKNGDYDPTTLNKQSNEVSEIITSLSEKDRDKYIIWQGELYKKEVENDKVVYKDKNGVTAKWLDEETEVTETMIEFLKAFNEIQENLSEEDKLLYNGGYITGLVGDKTDIKNKLPEGCTLLNSKGSEVNYYTTAIQLIYEGQKVAEFVSYGDLNSDGAKNTNDITYIKLIMGGSVSSTAQLIASDLNHDGIVNLDDIKCISSGNINQRVTAYIPDVQIIVEEE